MKIEFHNCPQPENLETASLPQVPEFVTYRTDLHLLQQYARAYEKYPNVLVIGHGGSINPLIGFYWPLKYQVRKKVRFLSTVDPDYIHELKEELKPEDTLVIAVSKSGETTTQIEALMQFASYPLLVITGKSSPLRAIGEKLGAKVVTHPPIGGRFSGFTEAGLLPAAVIGIDVVRLASGAESMLSLYGKDNLAWRAASVFWQLEQKGYTDVFMPFYSHRLFGMSGIIVQLCHESFGKGGKGQVYFAHEAPESQHHTNQRFFGGIKNICGFFVSSDSFLHPTVNTQPASVHSVQMKGRHLFDLDKIPLEKSLEYELLGTLEDARIQGIPVAHLSIAGFSAEEVGQMAAFWQLYSVYAAVLRQVDPFNQPQVENSKVISFNKRLEFKGLV